jgi:hypothetical protein
MCNGVVREDDLFKYLKRVGVYEEIEDRSGKGRRSTVNVGTGGGGGAVPEDVRALFGNVRELVFTQWGQKMHYLEITKVTTPQLQMYFYKDTHPVWFIFMWYKQLLLD